MGNVVLAVCVLLLLLSVCMELLLHNNGADGEFFFLVTGFTGFPRNFQNVVAAVGC